MAELLLGAKALDSKSSARLIPPPDSLPFPSPLLPWPLSITISTLSVFPLLSLCLSKLSSSRLLRRRGKGCPLRRKGRAGVEQGAGEWRSGSYTATPGGIICPIVYGNGAPWSCAVHSLGSRLNATTLVENREWCWALESG